MNQSSQNSKIPVKVVVLAMFEKGTPDDGDIGELEIWLKNEKLDKIPFPLGATDIYTSDDGLLVTLTGVGPSNAATTITALGCDPRFDLSKAYWIVAGIAGIDPEDGSLGSAVWSESVIVGDIMHEVDSGEIPEDWAYGKISLSSSKPKHRVPHASDSYLVFKLNSSLVDWAYNLTSDYPLKDYPELEEFRSQFKGYPNALKPPFVLKGDNLASSTYWHGHILNDWANDWVKMYTEEKGNFVVANMEDHGTVTAIKRLSKAGKADYDRLLILRTASNYSAPPPGHDAHWHFNARWPLQGLPSFEAAYQVGSLIVHEIIQNWEKYRDETPS
jgi:purine nucleoside permease